MYIREWRGRAKQSDAARYPEYFRKEFSSQLRSAPGFQGGSLSQREVGDQVEFLVLTRWKSMDAIREFTGSVAENAVMDPAPWQRSSPTIMRSGTMRCWKTSGNRDYRRVEFPGSCCASAFVTSPAMSSCTFKVSSSRRS